jgi:outer membrane protein OmpA-like peptidoglycan-associated protein
MKRPLAVLAGAASIAILAAGCSPLSQMISMQAQHVATCGPSHGVVLIAGAHRDAPAPSLDPRVACRVAAAIKGGKPVLLVEASGQPRLVRVRLLPVGTGTLAQRGSPRVTQDLRRVEQALADLRPHSAGVDDLGAFAIAADAARTAGVPHAELILLDSGLDDRGALDFTTPGMVAADPAEVAHQLRAAGNGPELRGFPVLLVGLGYTAPPQVPLAAKWRSNVSQIWTAVIRSSGGQPELIPQPAQGGAVRTSQPVRLVPVPADQPVRPIRPVRPGHRTVFVFTDASPVRFQPDLATFIDPAAAAKALAPIAKWLAADRSRHASLVGTTADVGPLPGQVALSRQRADRVRDELVALGARTGQISCSGVGSQFAGFRPDRNAAGILLAGPAELNRSVRITLRSQAAS